MVQVNEAYVQSDAFRKELENTIRNGDPEVLTVSRIRRELEKNLGLEEKALDAYKKLVSAEIDTIFARITDENETGAADQQQQQEEEEGSEHDEKEEAASSPTPEHEESTDDHEEGSVSPPPTKKRRKAEKPSTTTTPTPRKKKESKTTASTTSSATEETIKRLKSYIVKCGVRKVWSKELADCKTMKSQVEKLKSILSDLGVEGRPTLEKCQKVKAERELKAEIASLDTENILDEEAQGRRATRSQNTNSKKRRRVIASEDEDDEEEEEDEEPEEAPSNKLDVSFLGDQSDSD